MNLKKAFGIACKIENMAHHLRSDLEAYNPGNTSSKKIDLSAINLDAAIIESKLSQMRCLLCDTMLCS